MPNWCSNKLILTHNDKSKLQQLIQAWNQGKFLGSILPEPDYTKISVLPTFPGIVKNNDPVEPSSAWWDWRVQNWGTKWEIDSESKPVEEDSASLEVYFDTAWSPPIGVYVALADRGFDVKASYYEPGCDFCGRFTSENGEETFTCGEAPEVITEAFEIEEEYSDDGEDPEPIITPAEPVV